MNVKTKLSDYLRPLVAGALLLGNAALIPFASAGVQPLDRVVAIVDNNVIMQSQLEQRIREVQQTIDNAALMRRRWTSCASRCSSA
ncbi:Chaperone SurA [Stutzerimonas stutzeri]